MSSPALRPLSPKLEWPPRRHSTSTFKKCTSRLCCIGIVGMPRSKRANDQTDTKRQKGSRTVTICSTSVNPQTDKLPLVKPTLAALLRGRRVRQRGKALFRYFLCPCRLPVRSRAHEFAMPLSRYSRLPDLYLRTRPDRFRLVYLSIAGSAARSARVHNDHDFGTFCSCLE